MSCNILLYQKHQVLQIYTFFFLGWSLGLGRWSPCLRALWRRAFLSSVRGSQSQGTGAGPCSLPCGCARPQHCIYSSDQWTQTSISTETLTNVLPSGVLGFIRVKKIDWNERGRGLLGLAELWSSWPVQVAPLPSNLYTPYFLYKSVRMRVCMLCVFVVIDFDTGTAVVTRSVKQISNKSQKRTTNISPWASSGSESVTPPLITGLFSFCLNATEYSAESITYLSLCHKLQCHEHSVTEKYTKPMSISSLANCYSPLLNRSFSGQLLVTFSLSLNLNLV